jgi:hypothetical protein
MAHRDCRSLGKPATEPSRAFSMGNLVELGENVMANSSLVPHFWGAVPAATYPGTRDEEIICGNPIRRGFDFIPGQRAGACRFCCPRRSVGSHRPRTGRRGRRGIHWIFGGPVHRALLGTAAFRIVAAGSTCCNARPLHHARDSEHRFAAARQGCGVASGKAECAAGSDT